jgi:serine phosphatase RsbU (regulator of sigma subunit)
MLKRKFVLNNIITGFGYIYALIVFILLKYYGHVVISYKSIFTIFASAVGVEIILAFFIIIKNEHSNVFQRSIELLQTILWLIVFTATLLILSEMRYIAFFFAFFSFILFYSYFKYSNTYINLIFLLLIIIIYITTSIIGSHIFHYYISISLELIISLCFFPSAIIISYYFNIIKYQRNEINNARIEITSNHNKILKEIFLAKKIQNQLIPSYRPTEYIYSLYKPMSAVGGDFYDFFKFNNSNKIGIFISDVSGHGVSAAFITSMLKTILLQAQSLIHNPAELLLHINEVLQGQIANNFVTAFYGIYDPDNKSLLYSNAGHNQPYIITSDKVDQLQGGKNTAIAMFSNNMLAKVNKNFKNYEEKFKIGCKILFYTDGLVEARPVDEDIYFEYAHMNQIFMNNYNLPCDMFINSLMKELSTFRKSDNYEDDICLICLDVI